MTATMRPNSEAPADHEAPAQARTITQPGTESAPQRTAPIQPPPIPTSFTPFVIIALHFMSPGGAPQRVECMCDLDFIRAAQHPGMMLTAGVNRLIEQARDKGSRIERVPEEHRSTPSTPRGDAW